MRVVCLRCRMATLALVVAFGMAGLVASPAQALPYRVSYVDFSEGEANGNIELVGSKGVEFSDLYDNTSHLRIVVNGGWVRLRFFLPENWNRPVTLLMMHLCSRAGDHPGYSPLEVSVNGSFACHVESPGASPESETGSYAVGSYEVSDFVHAGSNTVTLRMGDDARTHYWMKWLMVSSN